MKKIKLLSTIATISITGGVITTLGLTATSCSTEEAPDMLSHIAYIAEHEFSVSAVIAGIGHSGTAWICDSTEPASNTYYLATNYHVTAAWIGEITNYYFYFISLSNALNHPTFNINEQSDYGFILDTNAVTVEPATGIYHNFDKTDGASYPGESADVSILKVDFSSVISNPFLEARLADVNQHKVEYRTNILTDNDWTYIAGFGSSLGDKQMQWQYAADRLYGYKWCRQAPATGVSTHPIPHTSPAATDISSTYEYPHGNMENKLQPGTSGSIAIDQHNQVVGIHWGEDRGHESVCWLTANGKDVRFTPTYTNIITILKAWMDSESI